MSNCFIPFLFNCRLRNRFFVETALTGNNNSSDVSGGVLLRNNIQVASNATRPTDCPVGPILE
jgi:hypothetical protein